MIPDSEITEPDRSTTQTFGVQTTATETGILELVLKTRLLVTPDREAFSALDLPLDVLMPYIDITHSVGPLDVEVAEEDPHSDALPLGVYVTALEGSDGLSIIRGLGDWPLNNTVAVTHQDGLRFLGLESTPALETINDDNAMENSQPYGSLLMAHAFKNTKDTGYYLMLFGPHGGSATNWVPENNGFGMTQLFSFDQNLTDGLPYNNDSNSAGYCYVNHTVGTVTLVEYNSDTGHYQSAGYVSSFPNAMGKAVSAFVRQEESLLAVTDGLPGSLYLQELSSLFDAATYIDDVGNSPRRIRSLGEVAVVSNFSPGSLSIFTWSHSDEVEKTETVPVGDGPVGIDLQELDSGDIAIVSTGFNDNTYWVTVVSSAGVLLSNTGYSLPAGITGPGHAAWALDDNNRILISGSTTGNLAVVASGL